MWRAFEILINFYQAVLMTYFVNKCCNLRSHAMWKDFALAFVIGIVICGMDLIAIYPLEDLLFLIPLIYSVYYRQDKAVIPVFWCFILALVFSIDSTLTSSLISMLTNASWEDLLVQSDVRVIYLISVNLLHTLMIALLTSFAGKRHVIYPAGEVCFLLSLVVQLAAAECFFMIRIQNTDISLTAYGSLGMLLSMILTVALHEIMIRQTEKQMELEVESQTNRLIHAHQEELQTVYSNILSNQHDLRHRITAAEQLLADQQTKASTEVIELLRDTDVLFQEYVTGNVSVDAILASKVAVMRRSGIEFTFYPTPLEKLPLSERQFTVMLSNILDNAIEGVMRLPSDSCSREIKLILSRNWDIFSVICENDMNPETVLIKDGDFVSSKENPFMHGFGTRSVRKMVENAGGMVDYSAQNRKFIVNVMLPMED